MYGLGIVEPAISDHIKRLILLSVITLSGGHCIMFRTIFLCRRKVELVQNGTSFLLQNKNYRGVIWVEKRCPKRSFQQWKDSQRQLLHPSIGMLEKKEKKLGRRFFLAKILPLKNHQKRNWIKKTRAERKGQKRWISNGKRKKKEKKKRRKKEIKFVLRKMTL